MMRKLDYLSWRDLMNFKDFIHQFLNESKLKPKFEILINSEKFEIIRDYHVRARRGNSPMSRDAGMSETKYSKILNLGLDHIDKTKTFTLTWTSNDKNNAISGKFLGDNKISIFGAIIGQKNKSHESLYRKEGTNRYHVGTVNFS